MIKINLKIKKYQKYLFLQTRTTQQGYKKPGKGQQHKRMCSRLGLGHALRGNTQKHASKHTKHARKHNEQTWQHMSKRATTYHAQHSGPGMEMDVQGGHLWVGMWMLGPKGMVGHGNGAWGGTGGR